jgi:hypothetical protein
LLHCISPGATQKNIGNEKKCSNAWRKVNMAGAEMHASNGWFVLRSFLLAITLAAGFAVFHFGVSDYSASVRRPPLASERENGLGIQMQKTVKPSR